MSHILTKFIKLVFKNNIRGNTSNVVWKVIPVVKKQYMLRALAL